MAEVNMIVVADGGPPPPPKSWSPPVDTGPERVDQKLTRKGMEQVIGQGGSVLIQENGTQRLAMRLDQLPSEADMAKGDEEMTANVRAKLLAQREAIDRDLAKVSPPPTKGK